MQLQFSQFSVAIFIPSISHFTLSSLLKLTWLLHILIKLLKTARGAIRMEEGRSTFKILTDTPLGRPRRRWEDNIRMDIKVTGINTRNCVDSAQDMDYWRVLVNAALNLRVP